MFPVDAAFGLIHPTARTFMATMSRLRNVPNGGLSPRPKGANQTRQGGGKAQRDTTLANGSLLPAGRILPWRARLAPNPKISWNGALGFMQRVALLIAAGFMLFGCEGTAPSVRTPPHTDSKPAGPSVSGTQVSESVFRAVALHPSRRVIRSVVSEYKDDKEESRPSRVEVIGRLPHNATDADRAVLQDSMFRMQERLITEHGIAAGDINMNLERDENVPHPGRVELASVPKTTSGVTPKPQPSEETGQRKPSTPDTAKPSPSEPRTEHSRNQKGHLAQESGVRRPGGRNKSDKGKGAQHAADSPSPAVPPDSPIRHRKPDAGPFIPKPDKHSKQTRIAKGPSKSGVSRKQGNAGPFIPRRRPGKPPKKPGQGSLPKPIADSTPPLPETIYFGGYIVAKRPDLEIPFSGSSPDAGDVGIVKKARATGSRAPKRCIDGRSTPSALVQRDDFRAGFSGAIYFLSGNHHTIYLSNIWLDDDRPSLAERIRVSGYDARQKQAKPLFRFDTDTEIYVLGSDIVFRAYPTNAPGTPILCMDARVSLKNPGKNGKVIMYYRHDGALYRYDARLRRLAATLLLGKGIR
uniref:Uncharacterized protein n=1 Tax=Candidatus Kentrum eta TaxID=2126337 RepID=A0A450UDW2_9GAMM|nr:MAG: hypothetical protein BECKH772A_GA0070896_1002319 [Candidatus Kentron sp. H]VFJ91793.1 MAG: hypothetical protein BECKH772B_GA0070898_1002119 [Candidatus Kentron sp. H]VFJ98427.1 MAG: hypothetical protein BECKH772C_GA0070978_1002119 [Candidatus Kentron sp. H]